MSLTVVGSIAFDAVKTPFGERERMLGGAATHFALAASFFDRVHVVPDASELRVFKSGIIGYTYVSRAKLDRWHHNQRERAAGQEDFVERAFEFVGQRIRWSGACRPITGRLGIGRP